MVSSDYNAQILIWDIETFTHNLEISEAYFITALCQLEDQRLIAGDGEGRFYVYDYPKFNKSKAVKAHSYIIVCIIQLKDKRVLTCNDDRLIKIWNLKTFECMQSIDQPNEIKKVIQFQMGD